MGTYPGPRPPLKPEDTQQMPVRSEWVKPFGPRWIGNALRRLRRKREDHGPPDELR